MERDRTEQATPDLFSTAAPSEEPSPTPPAKQVSFAQLIDTCSSASVDHDGVGLAAIGGWPLDVQLARTCPSRKSYPGIAMMQSKQNWWGNNRS
jgi:hypothetical protein